MNFRMLSASFAVLTATMLLTPAQAAISVLGSGPAELCYQAADSGASPFDSLQYCDQALAGALSPSDRAATYVNRGVLRLAANDVDSAAGDFNAGLAINANLGEAYIDRGATLIAHKRYADAILDINKGLKLGTKEAQNAYYDRAVAYEGIGDLQAAYDDYRQAVTLKPDFTAASQELARFKIVEKPSGA